jgi:hypothetical protein
VCVLFLAEAAASQCFTFFEWIGVIVKLCCSDDRTNNYTDSKMAVMYFMFGLADGGTREARHLYQEPSVTTGSW